MIRTLRDDDAGAYVALRREGLLHDPLSFASSVETDFASSAEAVRAHLAGAPIFGAFDGEQLVGAVGVMRGRHAKSRHKLQLWGMYVTPAHRRRGIAALLLTAALEHARGIEGVTWVQLGVTTAATDARRLYERAGFTVWGVEPDALRQDGQSVDEAHMLLRLR